MDEALAIGLLWVGIGIATSLVALVLGFDLLLEPVFFLGIAALMFWRSEYGLADDSLHGEPPIGIVLIGWRDIVVRLLPFAAVAGAVATMAFLVAGASPTFMASGGAVGIGGAYLAHHRWLRRYEKTAGARVVVTAPKLYLLGRSDPDYFVLELADDGR